MRAAVLRNHGDRSVTVVETDFPQPQLQPGWVLVRVKATSVNFHDIFTRRGMPGIKIPMPLIVGSDLSGVIEKLGEGVEGWQPGDRVLVDPLPCEGTNHKFVGEQFDGGRAEFCAVHASQLIALSDGISFEQAAALPLAYATGYRVMVTKGKVAEGETVLILGASGGVGTSCVLLSKMAGATVIACGSSDDKLARLKALGADYVINYQTMPLRESVHALVGKPRIDRTGGVDLAINYTGGKTWKDTLRCVGFGGRMVTCGATAGFDEEVDCRYIWTFEQSIIGSDGWTRDELVELMKLVESKQLQPVIDHVLPLEQVHEAERLLEDREVLGKVILVP